MRGIRTVLALSMLAAIALAAAVPRPVQAAPAPSAITFTARLTDAGAPVGGAHDFVFALWDDPTSGAMLWTETQSGVNVEGGLVVVELGSVAPFGDIFAGQLWLSVEVDGSELTGRIAMNAVPFAHRAGLAALADGLSAAGLAQVITGVSAGAGAAVMKVGSVVTVSVQFAGTGAANTAARSDHHHDAAYLKKGATLTCAGTNKVTGFDAVTGNVICGMDAGGTTYTGGFGITVTGADIAIDPTETQRRVGGTCGADAIGTVNADGTVTCSNIPGAAAAGGLVADGAGNLMLATPSVTTAHTALPMARGLTNMGGLASGSNDGAVVFNQAAQGTTCFITVALQVTTSAANASGSVSLRPSLVNKTTGVTAPDVSGFAAVAFTAGAGQSVTLSKTTVLPLTDNNTYDFGCRVLASGDWIGDTAACDVSYFCQ